MPNTILPKPISKTHRVLLLLGVWLLGFPVPPLHAGDGQQTEPPAPRPAAVTLTLTGLTEPVLVLRDARGVPYITAANDDDLAFAQGYVTASDRLWQMDLLRRTAAGELAEIFGERVLDEDRLHRTYGFSHICEATIARMDPDERRHLEAYAAGVNAYLDQCRDQTLPLECRLLRYRPRPWRPADTLLIGKLFCEALSTTWPVDLARAVMAQTAPDKYAELTKPIEAGETSVRDVLVVGTDDHPASPPTERSKRKRRTPLSSPPLPKKALLDVERLTNAQTASLARVGLHAEALAASNNWVVSGKRTTTGRPILANDPHLDPSAPGIWYMVNLATPTYRVGGVTAPGIPGVLIGHNERIAWGCTNLAPDVQDLFLETFDPERPRLYRTPQGWREAETRVEEIKVRRTPGAPEVDIVRHEVTVTRHGPVILERDGRRFALRWTALDITPDESRCYRRLARAADWNDFRRALADYGGATQNFVYADVDGNIGYYGAGRIPRRKSGDGTLPVDGATDAGDWIGLIPFDELPHVFNPPDGLIVTANSRVVGRSYPHFLTTDWAPPYRARRIYDLLAAQPKVSVVDCLRIQGDITALGALGFVRQVLAIADADAEAAADAEWQTTLRLLRGWNGELTPDSRAAMLALGLAEAVRDRLLTTHFGSQPVENTLRTRRNELPDWRLAIFGGLQLERLLTQRPANWLPKDTPSYGALLRTCHRTARERLAARLGADPERWTWGRRRPMMFPHPLAEIPVFGRQFQIPALPQVGGGGFIAATPNVGVTVSMRFVADLSQWDASRLGLPLGESGDPANPHWADQLESWRTCQPPVFPFSATAVEKAARATFTLRPPTTSLNRPRW
ncbi:MAG: penicillin acylase family protein [Chloracidobacterium sp.]|nr:penicillin acylase family protein [Chloracidobacterium sp.]MDW8217330.1 penicillin acylase family protein [Acidobacteriota bacterium]